MDDKKMTEEQKRIIADYIADALAKEPDLDNPSLLEGVAETEFEINTKALLAARFVVMRASRDSLGSVLKNTQRYVESRAIEAQERLDEAHDDSLRSQAKAVQRLAELYSELEAVWRQVDALVEVVAMLHPVGQPRVPVKAAYRDAFRRAVKATLEELGAEVEVEKVHPFETPGGGEY